MKETSRLFMHIKNEECIKAMNLIQQIYSSNDIKQYADAYTAVLIVETLELLNAQLRGFYAGKEEIIPLLFEADEDKTREKVIRVLCRKVSEARKLNLDTAIKKAENYIAENYNDLQLSAELLSDLTGASLQQISTLFKNKYGMGVGEYINNYKIEKSLPFLLKGEMNLDMVARMVGYCDAEAYSREFKRIFHVSPGRFRESAKKC